MPGRPTTFRAVVTSSTEPDRRRENPHGRSFGSFFTRNSIIYGHRPAQKTQQWRLAIETKLLLQPARTTLSKSARARSFRPEILFLYARFIAYRSRSPIATLARTPQYSYQGRSSRYSSRVLQSIRVRTNSFYRICTARVLRGLLERLRVTSNRDERTPTLVVPRPTGSDAS